MDKGKSISYGEEGHNPGVAQTMRAWQTSPMFPNLIPIVYRLHKGGPQVAYRPQECGCHCARHFSVPNEVVFNIQVEKAWVKESLDKSKGRLRELEATVINHKCLEGDLYMKIWELNKKVKQLEAKDGLAEGRVNQHKSKLESFKMKYDGLIQDMQETHPKQIEVIEKNSNSEDEESGDDIRNDEYGDLTMEENEEEDEDIEEDHPASWKERLNNRFGDTTENEPLPNEGGSAIPQIAAAVQTMAQAMQQLATYDPLGGQSNPQQNETEDRALDRF
ncbi:OLC1v1018773C1 [Oldenlandia corymbosa var. corymbosa]|uniref:OLC1v1018773C1 n=1 Tax=Oldenlandia corymbosa var. corymbosa TaxID=529605 RepID=A0AAV1ECD7_OLDCO|nr:OLC1v1018773C1 [Oldenlandia corymbosa var. corymbosa]